MDNINKIISARRKELGMTQAELALRLNISDKTVSKWETGASLPDLSLVKTIAEVLEISVSQLMGEVNEQNQQISSVNIEPVIIEPTREEKALDTKIVLLLKLQRILEFAFMIAIILVLTIPYIMQISLIGQSSDLVLHWSDICINLLFTLLFVFGLILVIYGFLMIMTFVFYKPGIYKNKYGSLFYFYSIAIFLLAMFILVVDDLLALVAGGLIVGIIKTIIFILSLTIPFLPFFVAKKRSQIIKKDKKNKILFFIAAIMLVLHLSISIIHPYVTHAIINYLNLNLSTDYISLTYSNSIFALIDGIFISAAIICHYTALKRLGQ